MIYYKYEHAAALRKQIEALLAAAIQDVLQTKIIHKVISSSLQHTDLEPEGHQFTINFVIEVHEKPNDPAV